MLHLTAQDPVLRFVLARWHTLFFAMCAQTPAWVRAHIATSLSVADLGCPGALTVSRARHAGDGAALIASICTIPSAGLTRLSGMQSSPLPQRQQQQQPRRANQTEL